MVVDIDGGRIVDMSEGHVLRDAGLRRPLVRTDAELEAGEIKSVQDRIVKAAQQALAAPAAQWIGPRLNRLALAVRAGDPQTPSALEEARITRGLPAD